jgi:hypothetical protein
MNTEHRKNGSPRSIFRGKVGWLLTMTAMAATLVACNTDKLLDAGAPDRVDATTLTGAGSAALLVNSAVGDFECALGSAITVEAIISDEFADAQLGAAGWPYDRRDANTQTNGSYGVNLCTSNQTPGIYLPLSTSRWSADNILKNLQTWTDAQVPNRQKLIAQAALYAGFSYSMLGMSMCQAAFDLQAQVDQPAMFALAEERFTTAIAAATAAGAAAADLKSAAYVGRARVRLFQGNTAGAATDAQAVPAGFVLNASTGADDNRRYNRVYAATGKFGFYTVDAISRGLTTGGVVDPRSAVIQMSTRPADATSTIYEPAKYTAEDSPIRIASWDEAQLILAETQNGATAVATINALRDAYNAAHPTGTQLPHYTGATDAASVLQLIIEERRRALFAEGFRNYDMQRFTIGWPASEAPGAPYPDKGGNYGTTTCLPLPDIERFNNPNIT